LRTEPTATDKSSPCWRLDRLPAGDKRVFRLTAQVASGSEDGIQRNRAIVTAANLNGKRSDSASVRVVPVPESPCGSRLARPFLLHGIELRC